MFVCVCVFVCERECAQYKRERVCVFGCVCVGGGVGKGGGSVCVCVCVCVGGWGRRLVACVS